ncbi:hypothetical protein D3C83_107120 [compost metagenome]
MDMQPALHAGVTKATKFGAGKLVSSRLGCFEPADDLTTWNYVLFKTQIRNKKTVDDIGGRQKQPNRFVDRHMNIVVEFHIVVPA